MVEYSSYPATWDKYDSNVNGNNKVLRVNLTKTDTADTYIPDISFADAVKAYSEGYSIQVLGTFNSGTKLITITSASLMQNQIISLIGSQCYGNFIYALNFGNSNTVTLRTTVIPTST